MLIERYLDGSLSDQDACEILRKLRSDSAFRSELENAAKIGGLIHSALHPDRDCGALAQVVQNAILAGPHNSRFASRIMSRLKERSQNSSGAKRPEFRSPGAKSIRATAEAKRRRNKFARPRKLSQPLAWRPYWILPIAAAAAFMFFFYLHNLSTNKNEQTALAAEIIGISGQVDLVRESASAPAQVGTLVIPGEGLKTAAAGRASLRYPDGTTLDLEINSTARLEMHNGAKQIYLNAGKLSATVAEQPSGKPMLFATPYGVACVLGTQLSLEVERQSARLEVAKGKVRFTNSDKKFVDVEAGFYAVAAVGVDLSVQPIAALVASETVSGPPKELVLDLGGGVKMELVLVKAGEFNMGSSDGEENEKPVHKVKISQPYYIGKYDVTVVQFRAFVDAAKFQTAAEDCDRGWTVREGRWQELSGVNWRNPGFKQEDNHPVVEVAWNDAQKFCKWATKATGRTVRLPSEAEWEYAARGPKSPKYPWGDKWEGIMANVADASLRRAGFNMQWGEIEEDDGYPFTSPCGAYKNASWCGAYDMAGNVWQWCQDYYNDKYYGESPAVDPRGPANGDDRVSRGGGWTSGPGDCRSARRHRLYHCDASTGFRVVVATANKAGSAEYTGK
jgi:formylglycine-generating enzyme required for sulfatase activity